MQFPVIEIPSNKNLRYFIIFFLILFIFQVVSSVLANYIGTELSNTRFNFGSLAEEFIVVVIVAPIVETLIFQYAVIETLLNLKVRTWICISTSALMFGIQHWYNPFYVAALTVIGFILSYYYMALSKQRTINSIVLLIIMHSIFNLIAFVAKHL